MVNRDYRTELGLVSPKKTVPRPVAIVVLVLVAVVLSFSAIQVIKAAKHRHASQAPVTAPAAEAVPPPPVTQ